MIRIRRPRLQTDARLRSADGRRRGLVVARSLETAASATAAGAVADLPAAQSPRFNKRHSLKWPVYDERGRGYGHEPLEGFHEVNLASPLPWDLHAWLTSGSSRGTHPAPTPTPPQPPPTIYAHTALMAPSALLAPTSCPRSPPTLPSATWARTWSASSR
ncbi:hypothetical protein AALO_G00221890 [Alosa alosa]|uniref:Uncharacterized protein n=1 Tax=Alosa alosa TaxID=278164 RepID=A0AAV6FX63_9TELE|nr:hypothetical protein AALO_G00221890 [Alosa alosa]